MKTKTKTICLYLIANVCLFVAHGIADTFEITIIGLVTIYNFLLTYFNVLLFTTIMF